jgi:hypothetical protein
VRVRRNQQRATQATGDRLAPPLREDLLGRMALMPIPRLTLPEATSGATLAELEDQVNNLMDQLSVLIDDMIDRGYMK